MADLLSLIREYNINKRDITERENEVIFGDFAWPKHSKTNYIIWGTNRTDSSKDYYTLECILYLLKNIHLNHAQYVRQAAASSVPVVRLPDRKDLLAYLNGEISTSENIDKSAPLDINVQRPVSKRIPTDLDADANDSSTTKRAKIEDDIDAEMFQREKERLHERLHAKLDDGVKPGMVLPEQFKVSSLQETMSLEKIQAIRAKRLVKLRGSIKQDEAGLDADVARRLPISYLTGDMDIVRDILSRERFYKSRNSCLQAAAKNFADSVLNGTLKAIKSREEGITHVNRVTTNPTNTNKVHHVPYSRYDQEKFTSGDATAALFKIDTSGWGMGMGALRATANSDNRPTDPRRLGQQLYLSGGQNNPNGGTKSPVSPGPQKRTSRTPIVIIPATASLIGMLNAKDILLENRFISVEDKKRSGCKRENEVLIQRMKADGTTAPFRVVDQPQKLTPEEWERVCAVFVQGPAWQFKNWPIGKGNPVDIFVKVKAFHLKYADLPTDSNVLKWNVTVLELDRHKRHLDRAVLQCFWDEVDKYMVKNKSHLRF